MTALQMPHPSQSDLAVTEDPMEVISDMDRNFELSEDIDIDLDLTGEIQADEEDDHMVEDSNSLTELDHLGGQDMHTSNDDEMIDGGYLEDSIVGGSPDHNEDIEDAEYVQPGIYEDINTPEVTDSRSEPRPEFFNGSEHIEASQLEDQDNHEPEVETSREQGVGSSQNSHTDNSIGVATVRASSDEPRDLANRDRDESSPVGQGDLDQSRSNKFNTSTNSLATNHNMSGPMPQDISHSTHEEEGSGGSPHKFGREQGANSIALEEFASAAETTSEQEPNIHLLDNKSVHQGANDSKEPSYMHPVMIIYQDNEISLFPPIDQEEEHDSTYFLQDERLASDAISTLLGACRTVLGESINVQDELMIDIEELGLHVTEFTPESSTTTLAEIIDIYIQLQHYDGQDDPSPLYMQLTTKPRFSQRLEFLVNAVAEEKGLSQIQFSNADEEDSAQPEAELASSLHASHGIDNPLGQEVGMPRSPPGEHRGDPTLTEDVHNTGGTANSHPNSSNTTMQAMEAKSSSISTGQEFENENTESRIAMSKTLAGEVSGADNGTPQNKERTTSPPAQVTHSEPQGQGESTTDNGDFVDYVDYDEQAHDISSGSSTLQGDSLDPATDGFVAVSELSLPSDETGQHPRCVGKIEGNAVRSDTVSGTLGFSMEIQGVRSGDMLDNDLIYTEHLEEQKGSDSDGRTKNEESPNNPTHGNERGDGDTKPVHQPTDMKATTSMGENGKTRFSHDDVQHDQGARVTNDKDISGAVSAGEERVEDADLTNADQADYSTNGSLQQEHRTNSDHDRENIKLDQIKVTSVDSDGHSVGGFQQDKELNAQFSTGLVDQAQEDEDEITYEDDESEGETTNESSRGHHQVSSSPGSLKRGRRLDEGDKSLETDVQDAKRVRSG